MKTFNIAICGGTAMLMVQIAGCATSSVDLLPFRKPNLYQTVPFETRHHLSIPLRNVVDTPACCSERDLIIVNGRGNVGNYYY